MKIYTFIRPLGKTLPNGDNSGTNNAFNAFNAHEIAPAQKYYFRSYSAPTRS
jgi:hypothetical protein